MLLSTSSRYHLPIILIVSLLLAACGAERPATTMDTDSAGVQDTAASPVADAPARKASLSGAELRDCEKLYEGTINNSLAVRMRLCRKGDELYGSYQYVKHGKDIELQGHVEADGDFILYEWGAGAKKQTGHFLGRFAADSSMKGTWVSPEGDKKLPFSLGTAGATTEASSGGDFSGTWTLINPGTAAFTLELRQSGDSITGFHCATTENATRVDCADMGEEDRHESIFGRAQGKSAMVTFHSTYGENSKGEPASGRARMTMEGNMVRWEVVGESDGEHWLPQEARLRRESSK